MNFLCKQIPYSPDISTCTNFLFPLLKTAMKGVIYNDILVTQAAVTRVLVPGLSRNSLIF